MRNEENRCTENFTTVIDKTKKKLNQWLQRDLSLKGRTVLTKAEGLSRITHAAIPLYVSKQLCTSVDKILFKNFLWKNKTHYVKKPVIMNTYDSGGLNFLDFTTLNNTFKINWIEQFLNNPKSIWNFIPN